VSVCLFLQFCFSFAPFFFVRFVCLFFVPHLAVMERQSLFLHTRQLGRSFQALMACMQIQTPPNKSLFPHTHQLGRSFQALMACMQKQGPTPPQTKNKTQKKENKLFFFKGSFFFNRTQKQKTRHENLCWGFDSPTKRIAILFSNAFFASCRVCAFEFVNSMYNRNA